MSWSHNEWKLINVTPNSCVYDIVQGYNNSPYIKNAFSYVGNSTGYVTTVTDNNDPRAVGTNSLTWQEFANQINQCALQNYNSWIENSFERGYFDVTPYYKNGKIKDYSYPCWVQLSQHPVDIDQFPANSVNHQNSNSLFTKKGWYCIAVNSGNSISDLFDNSILFHFDNDVSSAKFKLFQLWEANSKKDTFNCEENLMEKHIIGTSYFSHYTESDYLNVRQTTNKVFWVNIQPQGSTGQSTVDSSGQSTVDSSGQSTVDSSGQSDEGSSGYTEDTTAPERDS